MKDCKLKYSYLDVSLEALVAHMALVHLLSLMVAQDVSLEGVRSWVGFVTKVTLILLENASML
jgi:hypothetical protein